MKLPGWLRCFLSMCTEEGNAEAIDEIKAEKRPSTTKSTCKNFRRALIATSGMQCLACRSKRNLTSHVTKAWLKAQLWAGELHGRLGGSSFNSSCNNSDSSSSSSHSSISWQSVGMDINHTINMWHNTVEKCNHNKEWHTTFSQSNTVSYGDVWMWSVYSTVVSVYSVVQHTFSKAKKCNTIGIVL